jgi:hypothetical protein
MKEYEFRLTFGHHHAYKILITKAEKGREDRLEDNIKGRGCEVV